MRFSGADTRMSAPFRSVANSPKDVDSTLLSSDLPARPLKTVTQRLRSDNTGLVSSSIV